MTATDEKIRELVVQLSTTLKERDARLATAESCTGGYLAKVLTDQAGCSACFGYGFVTYGNVAKVELLNVSPDSLERHGAVSQDIAEQMATGARLAAASEVAVGITGIAGPDGGTEDKPVGTVWIAWAGPGPQLLARQFRFDGDRDQVRRQSVAMALEGLLTQLKDAPPP